MRARTLGAFLTVAIVLAGCGGTKLITQRSARTTVTVPVPVNVPSEAASPGAGIPSLATKNTTRVPGTDPIADAAGVALATYPSVAPGTHPYVVALAPTDDWQAALAASVLMSSPIRAPLLLSGSSTLPGPTATTLSALAPTGSGAAAGAQVIRVGDVPKPPGLRTATISGSTPFALAAAIDRFSAAAHGAPAGSVVIASGDDPAYAMPAAGYAAESGEPILFVTRSGVPEATRQALLTHQRSRLYVLGPPSVIPNAVVAELAKYGTVKRVGGGDPTANSVAFAEYRDPACVADQPCAHVPGSFGWAMRSPGHGYTLVNENRPLDAAASAALSASGQFGPQLLVANASTLPSSVLNFFLDYATPGYTAEGPTAAVYNHGWIIGDEQAISVAVQAEVDNLLEPVPQK